MNEMIDRVVAAITPIILKAMSHNAETDAPPIPTVGNVSPLIARAAIEAMWEPTEDMLAVEEMRTNLGNGPPSYTGGHNWILKADKQVWQAMIDAALK